MEVLGRHGQQAAGRQGRNGPGTSWGLALPEVVSQSLLSPGASWPVGWILLPIGLMRKLRLRKRECFAPLLEIA